MSYKERKERKKEKLKLALRVDKVNNTISNLEDQRDVLGERIRALTEDRNQLRNGIKTLREVFRSLMKGYKKTFGSDPFNDFASQAPECRRSYLERGLQDLPMGLR